MANEEQINRENGSAKDVSVPADKDATLRILEDVIKEEFTKLQSEAQKNSDMKKLLQDILWSILLRVRL